MSIKKTRLRIKNTNDTYDIVHPETDLSMVIGAQEALDDIKDMISGITGTPSPEYTHKHDNKIVLDSLSVDENGKLLLNGEAVDKEVDLSDYSTTEEIAEAINSMKLHVDRIIESEEKQFISLEDKIAINHSNRIVLDNLSEVNGELMFNNLPVAKKYTFNSLPRRKAPVVQ